jgi:hypothetical protein
MRRFRALLLTLVLGPMLFATPALAADLPAIKARGHMIAATSGNLPPVTFLNGFESGREPVYASASATEPTSFMRCSILPREIRGQSSITYVDPEDAGSKPRKYTVFVDEPIELP